MKKILIIFFVFIFFSCATTSEKNKTAKEVKPQKDATVSESTKTDVDKDEKAQTSQDGAPTYLYSDNDRTKPFTKIGAPGSVKAELDASAMQRQKNAEKSKDAKSIANKPSTTKPSSTKQTQSEAPPKPTKKTTSATNETGATRLTDTEKKIIVSDGKTNKTETSTSKPKTEVPSSTQPKPIAKTGQTSTTNTGTITLTVPSGEDAKEKTLKSKTEKNITEIPATPTQKLNSNKATPNNDSQTSSEDAKPTVATTTKPQVETPKQTTTTKPQVETPKQTTPTKPQVETPKQTTTTKPQVETPKQTTTAKPQVETPKQTTTTKPQVEMPKQTTTVKPQAPTTSQTSEPKFWGDEMAKIETPNDFENTNTETEVAVNSEYFSEFPQSDDTTGETIPVSRTVSINQNQRLGVMYPGEKWVFLGEQTSQKGLNYEQRKFQGGNTEFTFYAKEPGNYILNFSRYDAYSNSFIKDALQVKIGDRISGSPPYVKAPNYVLPTNLTDKNTLRPVVPNTSQASTKKPQTLNPTGDLTVPKETLSQIVSNEDLLEKVKKQIAVGDAKNAISNLDKFLRSSTDRLDEAYFYLGQAYELNGSEKNIKEAYKAYKTVTSIFIDSDFWQRSDERMRYIKRFFVDIE
ncbi:MAG: hypothetical protein P1P64_00915 [Treponemataceae bacterium]